MIKPLDVAIFKQAVSQPVTEKLDKPVIHPDPPQASPH